MTYADHFNSHLRITVLRFLEGTGGRSANASLLASAATDYGVPATRDQVATQLAWLQEQGLVTNKDVGGLTVAKLTARGIDVATGMAIVPGVQRPTGS